jgi:hypothetical protein
MRFGLFIALVSSMAFGNAGRASCEMHGLGVHDDEGPTAAVEMTGGSPHADLHEHGDAGAATSEACVCSCTGDCIAARVSGMVPHAPTVRVAVTTPQPIRALDVRTLAPRAADPDRLLPFANGPPRSLAV